MFLLSVLLRLEHLQRRKFHSTSRIMVKFLAQQEAINVDLELFNEYKFSVDQLMELAGLSCANAVAKCYPEKKNVLVCCGPGNNGGDGLVCARHLYQYGYSPSVYYPKRTSLDLYKNLTHQCISLNMPFIDACPAAEDINSYDLVIDALFGFSFKPPVRPDFVPIMTSLASTKTPICSIDIPSSWHVENGPIDPASFHPELLISLTAPKQCAHFFKGKYHFLGGRFVPPTLAEKYKLELPTYPGTENILELK